MTPAKFRSIREGAGLSLAGLAALLRMSDKKTIHRYETGERAISGPVQILMEMLEAGELPRRYLARQVQKC